MSIEIFAKLREVVRRFVELLRQCRGLVQQHGALGLPLRVVCDVAESVEEGVQSYVDPLIRGIREDGLQPSERLLLCLQASGVLLGHVDLRLDEVVHESADLRDLHARADLGIAEGVGLGGLEDRFLARVARGIHVREVLADDQQRAFVGLQPQSCYVEDAE